MAKWPVRLRGTPHPEPGCSGRRACAKSDRPHREPGMCQLDGRPVFAQPRSALWRPPPIGVRQRHRSAPASHIGRPGPQTEAVIALAGDGPRRSSDGRLLAGDHPPQPRPCRCLLEPTLCSRELNEGILKPRSYRPEQRVRIHLPPAKSLQTTGPRQLVQKNGVKRDPTREGR
jgi:hypothetical protein